MEPSEEIQRVVERWLAAVEAGDGDAIAARVSDHAGIVMIGTDAREWFAGPMPARDQAPDWHRTAGTR